MSKKRKASRQPEVRATSLTASGSSAPRSAALQRLLDRVSARERTDLVNLCLASLGVPLVWLLFGWDSSRTAMGHDGIYSLGYVADLLRAGGDWTQMIYRPDLLGGIKAHDTNGTPPLLHVAGLLGLNAISANTAQLFFGQVAFAVLGAHAAFDLAEIWAGQSLRFTATARLGVLGVLAFAPALGWRLIFGHANIAFGAEAFIAGLATVSAARNRTPTVTLTLVAIVTLLHSFSTNLQQVLYAVVFGGPLLLALAYPTLPRRRLAFPALVFASAVLCNLPSFAGLWRHALSTDAARGLGGPTVIYSYLTATARDWISSIPWGIERIPSGREPLFIHEVNYAFGPPLLLLALVPWRRTPVLGLALAFSLLVPVAFSLDLPGVATVLTTLVPPLRSFRVPERSVLSFALCLPIVAAAGVLLRFGDRASAPVSPVAIDTSRRRRLVAGGLIALGAVALGGGWVGEGALWIGSGWLVFQGWRRPGQAVAPAGWILLVLAGGSVAAFHERMLPMVPLSQAVDQPAALGRALRSRVPTLSSPLERVALDFEPDLFMTNVGYSMGISTLSGYGAPTRRFLELVAAVSHHAPDATSNNFSFHSQAIERGPLRPLYNVTTAANIEGGQLRTRSLGSTPGPAWFSPRVQRVGSLAELVATFERPNACSAEAIQDTLRIVSSDPMVGRVALPDSVASCADAAVLGVDAQRGGQSFHLHTRTDAWCPLTLATNYAETLEARAVKSDGTPVPSLALFPGYGALASVLVPPGATEVIVEAAPTLPRLWGLAWIAGLLCAGGALWAQSKR